MNAPRPPAISIITNPDIAANPNRSGIKGNCVENIVPQSGQTFLSSATEALQFGHLMALILVAGVQNSTTSDRCGMQEFSRSRQRAEKRKNRNSAAQSSRIIVSAVLSLLVDFLCFEPRREITKKVSSIAMKPIVPQVKIVHTRSRELSG